MHRRIPVWFVALATLGSGIIDIYSVMGPAMPHRMRVLEALFPLEFIHISRFLAMLIGFTLIVSAINIYKRKRRAYHAVILLSALSVLFHLTKGLDYEAAAVSVMLLGVLVAAGAQFTVKSSIPDARTGVLRFVTAVFVALSYGVAGFWLLDRRQFGIEFHIGQAIRETFRYLSFAGDPRLRPHTRYAHWFLDSLYVMTATAFVYSLYSLFRPALYQFRTYPHERLLARRIIEEHGRSALDFFKFWPDKSFFFSPSRRSVIAYRVGNGFALALADPVGPEEEIEGIISGFAEHCREHDWGLGFHQTLPDFLPVYEKLGFRKLKIGDDAIVDLTAFSLEGKERKSFRHVVNKLEDQGFRYEWHEPPLPNETLSMVKEVSDAWLEIAGRRERRFSLGAFADAYVRSTPVATVSDGSGEIMAFANQIPSYRAGEATIDLMRHRGNAAAGVMDYLFVKLFIQLKEKGFVRFNFGMAPMSGFQEHESASVEEKTIHSFVQHLTFLFSYRGLRQYKAKFADSWEPRYLIHRNPLLDLPRIAIALRDVSELKKVRARVLDAHEEEAEALSETTADEP
jgi:phosphatidylglycerol lysyltransferase